MVDLVSWVWFGRFGLVSRSRWSPSGDQVVTKWLLSGHNVATRCVQLLSECLGFAVLAKVPNFIILLRAGVLWKSVGGWISSTSLWLYELLAVQRS